MKHECNTTAACILSFPWKAVTEACLDAGGVLPSIRMQPTFFFYNISVQIEASKASILKILLKI